MKGKKLGRKYGFRKGNTPHNKGCTPEKISGTVTTSLETKRLTFEEHNQYTRNSSRTEVSPLNVRLLRPKSHGPTVEDFCSSPGTR